MQENMKKRVIWFSVFMLWVGMVVSLMVYNDSRNVAETAGATGDALSQSGSNSNDSPGAESTQGSGIVGNAGGNTNGSANGDVNGIANGGVNGSTSGVQSPVTAKTKAETPGQDFFTQYRMEREKTRGEEIDSYNQIINNPNTDSQSKKSAQEALLRLTQLKEQETQIEILLRGRGYADALACLQEDSAKVIVLAPGLKEADVAKIFDIVTSVTKLPPESIDVTPRWDEKR